MPVSISRPPADWQTYVAGLDDRGRECVCGRVFDVPPGIPAQRIGQRPHPRREFCSVECSRVSPLSILLPDFTPAPSLAPTPQNKPLFHPKSVFDFAAIHESCHAIVARHLGCHVSALLLCADGDGYCFIGYPKDSEGLMCAAVVTAAGVVCDSAFGGPDGGRTDREQIASLLANYQAMTGSPMPDPYQAARQALNAPGVSDAAFTLAASIRPGAVLTAGDIDRILAG